MELKEYSKILICGISGAGKTTLARSISKEYGHKPIYLDRYFWKENWTQRSTEELYSLVGHEIKSDKWVLEGALLKIVRRYSDNADLIIWLQPSKYVAIYRVLKRAILNYGKVREEFAEGCHEKINFSFIKWIWNYSKNKDAEIEAILENSSAKVIKVSNSKQLSL